MSHFLLLILDVSSSIKEYTKDIIVIIGIKKMKKKYGTFTCSHREMNSKIMQVFIANQGCQYCIGTGRTGRYVSYRNVYRYRNINISYRFKYRPYRPCTGHTGQFRAISAGTGRTGQYKKMFLFFIFLSFVIFEFLLGQNSNLFALTY